MTSQRRHGKVRENQFSPGSYNTTNSHLAPKPLHHGCNQLVAPGAALSRSPRPASRVMLLPPRFQFLHCYRLAQSGWAANAANIENFQQSSGVERLRVLDTWRALERDEAVLQPRPVYPADAGRDSADDPERDHVRADRQDAFVPARQGEHQFAPPAGKATGSGEVGDRTRGGSQGCSTLTNGGE